MINARAETVNEKPSFKRLLSRKRCLIPSSGFFEWAVVEDKKQPYFIRLKTKVLFFLCGIISLRVGKPLALAMGMKASVRRGRGVFPLSQVGPFF